MDCLGLRIDKVKLMERSRSLISKCSFEFSPHWRPAPQVGRSWIFLSFLCAVFLIGQARANCQAPKVTPVKEATDYQGNQPIPGRLGQSVTVEGVLTDGPIPVGAHASLADLQDSTGGIKLYSPTRVLVDGHIHRGDEVRISGTIQQYEGQTEILVQHIDRLGPGTLPPPRDVLAADILGTRYLGQLVRLEGKVLLTKNSLGQGEIILSDRSGQIPIYVGSRFFQDAQFARRLIERGPVNVVGIAIYSQPGKGPV